MTETKTSVKYYIKVEEIFNMRRTYSYTKSYYVSDLREHDNITGRTLDWVSHYKVSKDFGYSSLELAALDVAYLKSILNRVKYPTIEIRTIIYI